MPTAAICLSGHLRQPLSGFQNLCDNIICANPDFNFDIFIHTWDKNDWNNEQITAEQLAVFEPKTAVVEQSKSWDTSKLLRAQTKLITPHSDGSHVLSMFYKIKKCHEIMTDYGKEYDVVIRARSDLEWEEKLPIANYLNCENKVFVPNGGTIIPTKETSLVKDIEVIHSDFKVINKFFCCANDQFAISSAENMRIYAGTFDAIESLVEKYGVFCPEALLYQQLIDNGLKVVPIKRASYLSRKDQSRVYFGPP
jgi:hypothetical protein